MLEIVGSNQAVHLDYVSDSLAPMDTLKWSRKKNEKGGDEMTRPAGPIPQTSRQSKHSELISLLQQNEEKREKDREIRKQEREKRDIENDKRRDERHKERMTMAQSMVDTMRMLIDSSKKKRRRHSSDSD